MGKKNKASRRIMQPESEYWDTDNWLWKDLDSDDELLIAYNRRPSEQMVSMCALCYQWFKSSDELHDHMVTHIHNSRFHECSICQRKFIARFLCARHEAMHRFDSNHPYCRYWEAHTEGLPLDYYVKNHPLKRLKPVPFSDYYLQLLRRLEKKTKSDPITCISCDKLFQDYDALQEHYDKMHAVHQCINCLKILESSAQYESHLKLEHGVETPVNLPGGLWSVLDKYVAAINTEREQFRQNIKFFHNYANPNVPLKILNQNMRPRTQKLQPQSSSTIFSEQRSFQEQDEEEEEEEDTVEEIKKECDDYDDHGNVEKQENEENEAKSVEAKGKTKPVTTGLVKSRIIPRRSTKSIYARDHTGDMPSLSVQAQPISDEIEWIQKQENVVVYSCQVCGKQFDDDKLYNRHRRLHNVPGGKPFDCKFCSKSFATHSNRKEHERIHTGERPYKCPVCDRAFIQISNLKKHIQTHKELNHLQCETCGKQFVKESSLVLHQRAHATERKFRCEVCDRAYNYASLLKRHMRIHTGECPYQCPECNMPFHELVSLHYHRKKMHTGERPHKCEVCGRGFILSSDLKKHHRIHVKKEERDGSEVVADVGAKEPAPSKFPPRLVPLRNTPIKTKRQSLPPVNNDKESSGNNSVSRADSTLSRLESESKLDSETLRLLRNLNPEITLIVNNKRKNTELNGEAEDDDDNRSLHFEIEDVPSNVSVNGHDDDCVEAYEVDDDMQIVQIKDISEMDDQCELLTNGVHVDESPVLGSTTFKFRTATNNSNSNVENDGEVDNMLLNTTEVVEVSSSEGVSEAQNCDDTPASSSVSKPLIKSSKHENNNVELFDQTFMEIIDDEPLLCDDSWNE